MVKLYRDKESVAVGQFSWAHGLQVNTFELEGNGNVHKPMKKTTVKTWWVASQIKVREVAGSRRGYGLLACKTPVQKMRNSHFSTGLPSLDRVTCNLREEEFEWITAQGRSR